MATRNELLKTAKTLGISSVGTSSSKEELRAAIQAVLGEPDSAADQASNDQVTDSIANVVAKHGEEAIATATGAVLAGANSIPNLSPNGKWEGKRARVLRTTTGQNDMGGAIFNWNGWITIIPIDTPVDVAWPIYEILKETVGVKVRVTQEQDGEKIKNVMHKTEYRKYPFQFMGVTPGTENLPEHAWEYTLDQYVEGFKDFTVQMWRQLCVLWELTDSGIGLGPGVSPTEEVKIRENAIHAHLNLPYGVPRETREVIRDQKRVNIGMKAA